ncbi:MAG: AsmA family protein, partial [Desulfobacterales bacterium]
MPTGNRKKPIALGITAVLVLLFLVFIIALPFILDVNQFRPQIESRLTNALGRQVKLGNLSFSLLSGSVKVDDLAIADNPAFGSAPFLTSKSLKVGIELKPLVFSKQVHITAITLDNPTITLIRSHSGRWNFSDLGSSKELDREISGTGAAGFSEADLFIKQLKITDGRINYVERGKKPFIYDQLNFSARNISLSAPFNFTMTVSLPGGGNVDLEGKAGPLNRVDMLLTPLTSSVTVKDLNLAASGAVSPDSGISGVVNFTATLSSDGRRALTKGNAEAESIQFVKGGSPAGEPIQLEYTIGYDLVERKGNLSEGKLHTGRAVARLNGNYD